MKNFLGRTIAVYIDFVKERLFFSLIVIAVITGLSVYASSKLGIKSDLKELLPDNYASVNELNKMVDRVGGVGNLMIVVESSNFEANKRFMDDMAGKLSELPKGKIRYLDYKSDEVKHFYEKYFLYYLNTEDLDRLYGSVERRISYEKVKHSPLFIDLTDEDPLISEIDEIKEANRKNYSSPVQTVEDYYGGEWGRMLIMIVRPFGASLTVNSARELISTVENISSELNPASYSSEMKVGLCGNVVSTVEEHDTLKKDILSTTLLCVSLVCFVIILFFLRLRIVFLLGLTLAIAVSWTFAIAYFLIGYLNSQTAFLGSIIVGTGINYGIIVMARYVEERKKGSPHTAAMKEALTQTFTATFLAASTAAVSFAILLLAKIKGLSQFGIIGAIGVMLCWVAMVTVLPVLTIFTEKVKNMIKQKDRPRRSSAIFSLFTRWVVSSPKKIFALSTGIAFVSVILAVNFAPDSIEYDFTKMRNKTSVSSGTEALEKRISPLFKHSMTPAIVLVDDMKDAQLVCSAVDKKNMALPEGERRVGSCYSIFNLLPSDQKAKLPKIEKFRRLLDSNEKYISKLDTDLKQKIDTIKRSISGKVLTLADIPHDLTRHFEDLKGDKGVVVFINPRPGMLLSDGRNLIKFANTIKDIPLEDGRVLHSAGASMIFSDLVQAIRSEAPYLTAASFLCVILFIIYVARRWKASWTISLSLVMGILFMVGAMSLLRIKLNFFNFIALPLTFGVGADYAINISLRMARDGTTRMEDGLKNTGAAVILCSLTTIIGYAVLMFANNQALASFGMIAIIGEITCVGAALMLTPALLLLLTAKVHRKKSPELVVPTTELGEES